MKRRQKGISLIELLAIIAIVTILVVIAVPSYISFAQLNRIKTLNQNLYYNLTFARSEAIKRNASVYVSFTTGSNWCYGINLGSSCSCSVPSSCSLGAFSSDNTQATLSITGLSGALVFEPNHGDASASPTITYTITSGTSAVSVKVSLSGNVQTCSANVSGYQACT